MCGSIFFWNVNQRNKRSHVVKKCCACVSLQSTHRCTHTYKWTEVELHHCIDFIIVHSVNCTCINSDNRHLTTASSHNIFKQQLASNTVQRQTVVHRRSTEYSIRREWVFSCSPWPLLGLFTSLWVVRVFYLSLSSVDHCPNWSSPKILTEKFQWVMMIHCPLLAKNCSA